jgi:hypothetical protein
MLAANGLGGGSKGDPGGNVTSAMGGAAGQSRAATVAQKNAFTQNAMAADISKLAGVAQEQLDHLRLNFERDRRYHEESQSAFTMVNKTLNRGFRALTTGTRFNPNNRGGGGSQGLGIGDLLMARMMGFGGGGARVTGAAGRMGMLGKRREKFTSGSSNDARMPDPAQTGIFYSRDDEFYQ